MFFGFVWWKILANVHNYNLIVHSCLVCEHQIWKQECNVMVRSENALLYTGAGYTIYILYFHKINHNSVCVRVCCGVVHLVADIHSKLKFLNFIIKLFVFHSVISKNTCINYMHSEKLGLWKTSLWVCIIVGTSENQQTKKSKLLNNLIVVNPISYLLVQQIF